MRTSVKQIRLNIDYYNTFDISLFSVFLRCSDVWIYLQRFTRQVDQKLFFVRSNELTQVKFVKSDNNIVKKPHNLPSTKEKKWIAPDAAL